MINVFGIEIHEFSIALSDLFLSLESLAMAFLLLRNSARSSTAMRRIGAGLFISLSVSSLLGALFHAFFPLKVETLGGYTIWMSTILAIGCTALLISYCIAHILQNTVVYAFRHIFASVFSAAYILVIFFIDYHYATVILFYAPLVVLLGGVAVAKFASTQQRMWLLLALGIFLSIAAALIQLLHISFDPVYFNFNTLYHIVQAVALLFLFVFFKEASNTKRRR